MINLVDFAAPYHRALFQMIAKPQPYRAEGAAPVDLLAFLRGLASDQVFASVMQGDLMVVLDAAEFAAKIGPLPQQPRRFDRIVVRGLPYSVEEVRGSPEGDQPVFWKLKIRGGQQ